MAKRITAIKLHNYRAWDGEYDPLELPQGENALIYGENGSGKSSLFLALQNFFRSSLNGEPLFEFNRFAAKRGDGDGRVSLTFSDLAAEPVTTEQFDYTIGDASTNQVPFIRDTTKLNSFLDYRSLLGLHYAGHGAQDTPNLFIPIVEDLLRHFRIAAIGDEIGVTHDKIEKGLASHGNSYQFSGAQEYVPEFKQILIQVLGELRIQANRLLHTYFKNNTDIIISEFEYDETYKAVSKVLRLNANYYGEQFTDYNTSLNEARLSAMAICMCLAAVLSHPAPATEYKILVLDDIFIGLDTSNRLPLLKILETEFSDYQIIITTYDRNWFELAKAYLQKGNWKLFELFHEQTSCLDLHGHEMHYEKPVAIAADFDYLIKAEKYFKARDYPACANYLRKELERIVRKLLPLEWRVKIDDDFGTRQITKLEDLLNQLTSYYDECGMPLPKDLLDNVRLYRKLVLNPQSHDDIQSPIYRAELEQAFDVIQALQVVPAISKVTLLPMKTRLLYSKPESNYTAQIELASNLERVEAGGNVLIVPHKFRFLKWTLNGIDYATNSKGLVMEEDRRIEFCEQLKTLQQIFDNINYALKGPIPANLEAEFVTSGRTLHDILSA